MTVLVALALPWLVAQEPSQELVFRSSTRRVLIDVFVTIDGRPVGGLTADAFSVLDNGEEQTGVTLLAPEALPLAVTLALDTSGSVAGRKLQTLRDAAKTLIEELDHTDAVAIVTFNTRYRLQQRMTRDHARAQRSLGGIRAGGSTALFDAMFSALVYGESDAARPLVVLFSDGLDSASWLTAEEVLASAGRSEAVVFAVRATSEANSSLSAPESGSPTVIESHIAQVGAATLDDVVATSAGRVLSIDSTAGAGPAFQQILREMRNRYVLAYRPSDESEGRHDLEVLLKDRPNATIRARSSYYFR